MAKPNSKSSKKLLIRALEKDLEIHFRKQEEIRQWRIRNGLED